MDVNPLPLPKNEGVNPESLMKSSLDRLHEIVENLIKGIDGDKSLSSTHLANEIKKLREQHDRSLTHMAEQDERIRVLEERMNKASQIIGQMRKES
jgi:hypothetical protein